MSNLADARVFIVKDGDESERFTPEVNLEMNRPLREDGSLTLGHGIDYDPSPALFDEPSLHLTVASDVKDLCRAGMCVWGVHPTRSNLNDPTSRQKKGKMT